MAQTNGTVVLDDKATWDKWRKACEEADEEGLDELFEGLEEADGVHPETTATTLPTVVDPWVDSGMSEEEWVAQQKADADTWEV